MLRDNTARNLEEHLSEVAKLRTEQPCTVLPFMCASERLVRAAAFDATLRATRTSNGVAGRALGVDERIVRDLRSGRRPLTDARVALFGDRLRAAYEAALAGPLQLRLF